MKAILVFALALISITGYPQVKSVDMMPPLINKEGTINSEPSFNSQQNLLCFYRESKSQKSIMISTLSNGVWSEPYVAIDVKKLKGSVFGLMINPAGTRIYIGWNTDLYYSEFVGENTWTVPLKFDGLSSPAQDQRPSISADDNILGFMSNRGSNKEQGWVFSSLISQKNQKDEWSTPKSITIKDHHGEIEEFIVGPSSKIVFYSTASSSAYQNYYASLNDSVYANSKLINFGGGRICWISNDLSTGLAETFTKPKKIIKINFVKESFELPNSISSALASRDVQSSSSETSSAITPKGKYYGLLIGVSDYADASLNLSKPVKDSYLLKEILSSKYDFEKENIKVLTNPTRQEIIGELFRLRSVIGPDDNLLIFFAGHGYWDKNVDQGYWWPKDAKQNDPSYWLSNSDLREQVRGIKSGHTLLISDACFSGGIFKTRGVKDIYTAPTNIQLLYKTKSRRAITSGNMSTVPDQSVFFNYLSNRLNENTEKFLPSQTLFNSLKVAVINNSMTIPQEGVISDSGDEGGDFIFIKK